jgi:hypothetical protein
MLIRVQKWGIWVGFPFPEYGKGFKKRQLEFSREVYSDVTASNIDKAPSLPRQDKRVTQCPLLLVPLLEA